jgi:hypothetical protein
MRGQSLHQTQVVTFASGASVSAVCPIDGANRVAIEFPSFGNDLAAAAANAYVQVGVAAGGTFRRLQDMGIYSASSGLRDWEIPSFSGDRTVLCRPVVGFDYMKVHLGTAATNGYSVTVHKLF